MTKYDWSGVEKNTRYIATDADGYAHGWNGEPPKYINDVEEWIGEKSYVTGFMLHPNKNPIKGNWQDSLEERPTNIDLPETVVKSLGEVA